MVTKQCNNKKHSSTKLTTNETASENTQVFVYTNLLCWKKKVKPEEILGVLRSNTDNKNNGEEKNSKCGIKNWSYTLFTNTQLNKDTIPS